MPIEIIKITHDPLTHGHTWAVMDEALLIEMIARVALGQARHVQKILRAAGLPLPVPTKDVRLSAIKMLTVPVGEDPWHRDGWMFQIISWISALKANPNSPINAPHMIHAQKGLDGLQLIWDETSNSVSGIVIFEDKATDNPRSTIRDLVWPEFAKLELGESDNMITAEVTALLEKSPVKDIDDGIRKAIWKEARQYRVSITVGDDQLPLKSREKLFKGYDEIVAGVIDRRGSETFYVKELRPWMKDIADKAIIYISSVEHENV